MGRLNRALGLLIIAICVFGCSDDDGVPAITFETLAIGDQSPIEIDRSRHVINDAAAYEALFGSAATNVDFDTETVIAAFLGPISHSDNEYEITEIADQGTFISVVITWTVPRLPVGPETNHYHVIKTAKITGQVIFTFREVRL